MTPFHLTVLGPPELRAPNGDPIRFRTRKHLALLVYLAVEKPIAHRRDKLATLLWPGGTIEEARHSLATGLSLLRSRIGGSAFDTTRDSIRLVPGRLATDLPTSNAGAAPLGGESIPGMFLEEFEIPGAPEFQQWCDAIRARTLPRLQGLLVERINDSRRRGDSQGMQAFADQLQEIDHLSEEAVRAQLEARAMLGDRIGALRVFEKWRAMLASELGASPSPTLERAASRLRATTPPSSNTKPSQGTAEEVTIDPAFFGRQSEFAACYLQWERARELLPSHAIISGERGIGKTALAARVAAVATLDGARTTVLTCRQSEQTLDFNFLVDILENLTQCPGALATPPEHLANLLRRVPRLASRFPDALIPPSDHGADCAPLLDDAIALINAVSAEQPLLIVVDDSHFMDSASKASLCYLMRRLQGGPFMFLLTAINAGAHTGSPPPWDDLPTALVRHVPLGCLSRTDSQAIANHILGPLEPSERPMFDALIDLADGNPLAIQSLAGHWRRSGAPQLTNAIRSLARTSTHDFSDEYSSLVDAELRQLDPEVLAVARLAAVLDTRMNDLDLYSHIGLSPAAVLRAMAALEAEHIILTANDGAHFRNHLVKERCYAGLLPPFRSQLHALVAGSLLRRLQSNQSIDELEIAWHLMRAGNTTEAIPYLSAGGANSIRHGRPQRADRALSEDFRAIPDEDSRSLMLALAEAKQEMGQWEESQRVLDSAGRGETASANTRAKLIRTINERFLGYLIDARLEEAIGSILSIARNSQEPFEFRARAASIAVALISSSREKRHIRRLGSITSELRRQPLSDYQAIHVAHAHGWYIAQAFGPQAAIAILREGVALIEKTGTADSISTRLLLGAGVSLCQRGHYSEAAPLLHQAHSIASKLGNNALLANAASGVALVEGRLGNHASQIEFARQTIRSSSPEEWGICVLSAAYDQGLGLAVSGQTSEAEVAMATFDTRFDKRRPAWIQQAWKLCKADVLALAGNERKALHAGRVGTSGALRQLHHDCFAGQYARWVAFAGLRTGTAAGALARLAGQIENLERHDAKDQVEILASVAMLESSMGREASGKWAEVREKLDRLPIPTQTIIRRLGVASGDDSNTWGIRGLKP